MILAGTSKPAPTIHAVAKLKPDSEARDCEAGAGGRPSRRTGGARRRRRRRRRRSTIRRRRPRPVPWRAQPRWFRHPRSRAAGAACADRLLPRRGNRQWPGFVPAVLFIEEPSGCLDRSTASEQPAAYGWGAASAGGGLPTLVVISFAGAGAAGAALSLAGFAAGATTTSGRARLVGGASTAGASARCGGML